MDAGGNLYSTTQTGGSFGAGTVFELTPHAGGNWTESVLWNFNPGSLGNKDGISPAAGVIMDASGRLYGTTSLGGANFKDGASIDDGGTAFMLTPSATVGGVMDRVNPLELWQRQGRRRPWRRPDHG